MADDSLRPPYSKFEDDIRPAEVLLRVHRLLDCDDKIVTDGELVQRLRTVVAASSAEEVLVLHNEIFLGIVRERARLQKVDLRNEAMTYLLRQAVVVASTALEAYLANLLLARLPGVIAARPSEFSVTADQRVRDYFQDRLKVTFDDLLRVMNSTEAPLFITGKLLAVVKSYNLSGQKGVHVAASLLGLKEPWREIATHLGKEPKTLSTDLEQAVIRRNDIVHRGDRESDGVLKQLSHQQATVYVDTIRHVCGALHELVEKRPAAAIAAQPPGDTN